MNHTIIDHLDKCFDELIASTSIKTYKITIKKNGVFTQWIAKGESLNKAENSVQAYVGGNIQFVGGKELF